MTQDRYSKRAAILSQAGVILATLLVISEYWLSVRQPWVFLLTIPGILWYAAQRSNVTFVDGLMLVIYTLVAALFLPAGGSAFLALCIILLALSAWQLSNLSRRLAFVQDPQVEARLFRKHTTRLGFILVSSLFLCSAAIFIKLELRFWVLLGLMLLAVLGLSQLVGYINRQGS